ncbi:MAG: 30S ribosomal protein S16 [Phycisphaeraceae bacterium]|nr:30S ribosomal protein S16 [Phycisphaeraceae bacterium]MBX3407463.1 30S ribosomal protein S16 [Phycisphaeraceae bacterium]
MVRIRMKRMGRPHRPFYRISAIEKASRRDGAVLENLGIYDPMATDEAKQLRIDEERIKFWLAKGAQPSDTMMDVLAKRNLVDAAKWKTYRDTKIKARKARAEALAAAGGDKKDKKK